MYLNILLFLICLSAIIYYCYSIYAALDFFADRNQFNRDFQPPITILKPLCGLESELYNNLASFCQQDYPEYQIIFSVKSPEDPSIKIVKDICQNFPNLDISLVINDRTIGINPKVSNLANAAEVAKHPFWLIADSDIRVRSDYLKQVIQPMHDDKVGVVTCLYSSVSQGWLATFEALNISTQFHPRVLTARKIEGIKFAFGSTILIRKKVLEEIGGFGAIANFLADDYRLGNLPAQKGYKVILSNYVVEHFLADVTIREFIDRQVRWAKCVRVERFWGYLGLIFTEGTTTSLLFLILSKGSYFAWITLISTWSLRLLMAWIVGVKKLKDSVVQKAFCLIPLRDLVGFIIWCYGFVGNKIEWRGKKFRLSKDGVMSKK